MVWDWSWLASEPSHGEGEKTSCPSVETNLVIGRKWRLEDALEESEDSHKLNTSFIERLNLTVRQGSAYLGRRTACHSRSEEHLQDQLELQRCHYHFIRRHSSLRFGSTVRTPAMQAGLAMKRLSFREVFLSSREVWGSNVTLMAGHRCEFRNIRHWAAA